MTLEPDENGMFWVRDVHLNEFPERLAELGSKHEIECLFSNRLVMVDSPIYTLKQIQNHRGRVDGFFEVDMPPLVYFPTPRTLIVTELY